MDVESMEQHLAAALCSFPDQQLERAIRPLTATTRAHARRRAKRPLFPMTKVARQRSMEFNLALDINDLHQEVQNLLQLREILATKALVTRSSLTGSLVRLVHEFFKIFQRGYQPPAQHETDATGPQAMFLATMMRDDVDCYDGLVGHRAILAQSRKFSNYTDFQSIDMLQNEVVEIDGRDTNGPVKICASGVIHTRLLRETLVAVFPHILVHEELCLRLIDQPIDFPITTQFIFNNDGKVYVFRVEIDFVAGLSATLGLEDIALVLGDARIVHSMLCIDDEPAGSTDRAFATAPGGEDGQELVATVFGGEEPVGELPSLFALDEFDDDVLAMSMDASVLPIDLAEFFKM